MSELPLISIISVNWNGKARLEKFFNDLRTIDYPKDRIEVIVHDNASTDGSQDIIAKALGVLVQDGWRRTEFIAASVHPGPNAAYEACYRLLSGDSEFILGIDNDVRLEPGALRQCVETMRLRPEAAVVGCRVLYAAPPHRLNCGAVFFSRWSVHSTETDPAVLTACDEFLDCVYFARRAPIDEIGVFHDPDLYFFCMGKELFTRLKKQGWEVLYDPAAVAYHDAGFTSKRHPDLTYYLCVRDNTVFNMKHSSVVKKGVFLFRTAAAALMYCVRHRRLTGVVALRDGIIRNQFDPEWWQNQMALAVRPR